jgi:AcrR family transcriptional regulator
MSATGNPSCVQDNLRVPLSGKPKPGAGDVRQSLLLAATKVFEQLSFHETRVADIARQAGLSSTQFYRHFGSKLEIFREIALATDRTLIGSADPSSAIVAISFEERLRLSIKVNFQRFRDSKGLMKSVAEVCHIDPLVREHRSELRRREASWFEDAICDMQCQGTVDRTLDAKVVSVSLGAMAFAFAERWFIYEELERDFDTGIEQFIKIVLNALGVGRSELAGRHSAPTQQITCRDDERSN